MRVQALDAFTIAAYLILVAAVAIGASYFFKARKRTTSTVLSFVGAWILLTGLLFTALISTHVGTIVTRAFLGKGVGDEAEFHYNFRFYSLMLLGFAIALPSITCVVHARKLTEGNRQSWQTVLKSQLILLTVALPLFPIQRGFSIGFSAFSLVALATLWFSRKYFGLRPETA